MFRKISLLTVAGALALSAAAWSGAAEAALVRPSGPALKRPAIAPGGGPDRCREVRPILAYTGSEAYSTGAGQFVRYKLMVRNWHAFCPEMFKPAPHLPPCGLNANSSRSWVDVFDSATGQRLYGFCALGKPQGLTSLWFAKKRGQRPPRMVHIVIHDRQANKKFISNRVMIAP